MPATPAPTRPTRRLSLSVRIAENAQKTGLDAPLDELVALAAELGYHGLCMRASAGGVQTPRAKLERMRTRIEDAGLTVTMVTADFDVPLNNERGPASLRRIGPSLDVAEALGSDLVRVCLKTEDDIEWARRAADQAADRGLRLAHQCHTRSLFERVDDSLEVLARIDRKNFGLIYEPANLMLCGEAYGASTLRRLRPHLMNVYVQNHRLEASGPAAIDTWTLGTRRFINIPIWEPGGVDFDAVAAGLDAIGFDGYVTVHQAFGSMMAPREAARESARYLRRLLAGTT